MAAHVRAVTSILQESKTVDIADADWTDEGSVELVTFPPSGEHRTHMAPETARALAQRLLHAAADAEKAMAETHAQRADRAVQHGFDVDLDGDFGFLAGEMNV